MADRTLAQSALLLLVLAGFPALSGQESAETAGAAEAVEPAETPEAVDPLAALAEGNRLFRNGQIEAAAEAYRAGWTPQVSDPTLLYNLGTAYHHLGRLPEAILWYRRAAASGDPWLEDNLRLARGSLGSRALPLRGLLGVLARHAAALRWLAIVLSGAALVVALIGSRLPFWVLGALLLFGAALYGSAVAVERWGPRPAVLLADCETEAGELPAGTEAWVRRRDDGSYGVEGAGVVCPAEAVGLIFP